MTLSPSNPRARPRWLLLALMVVALLAVAGSSALAVHDDGKFELDKNATNNLTVTKLGELGANITASASTLSICQTGTAPAASFTILIEAERMTVTTNAAGNFGGNCGGLKRTYSVTRGAGGTTATAHAKGGVDGIVSLLVEATKAGTDWNQVHAAVLADPDTKCLDLGLVECAYIGDGIGPTTFIGGASKDHLPVSGWQESSGASPDKAEILNAYAAKAIAPNGNQILYFGMDRYAVDGSTDIGFWFFKGPVATNGTGGFTGEHQVGDILALATFSQGGATSNIRVFRWVGTGGNESGTIQGPDATFGDCVPGSDNDNGCGTVNDASIEVPWTYTFKGSAKSGWVPAGGFFEGGIDLTALNMQGCFSSFLAETRSSPEITAILKDFALGTFESCDSSLSTRPGDGAAGADNTQLTDSNGNGLPDVSIGSGSVQVRDRATLNVSGIANWSGNLKFWLCGPLTSGECTSGGVPIGPAAGVTVNQSSGTALQSGARLIPSEAATLTSVGRYCWRAEFTSATPGVPNGTDASPNECFEVLPVTPGLDTAAVAGAVAIGSAAQDNATLSGTATQPGTNGGHNGTYTSINATNGAAAGGKITFTLLKNDCSTLATGTGTNPQDFTPISGNATYGPVSFTPDAAGTYHWKAQYTPATGDPNNIGSTHNAACNDTDETVKVVDARISINPPSDTNAVGDPHTFTVKVEQNDGTGWANAPEGTGVTVTLTETNGAAVDLDSNTCVVSGDPPTGGTVNGECTVTFTSDTAGKITGRASVTFNVAGVSLTRATDGVGANSSDAVKFFVDAQIDLSPLTATNEVNDAHEITATVQQDDGRAAADLDGDGVLGWTSAPNGTTVTFSLLNNTADAAFVDGIDSCTTTGGTCSVFINTSTAGSVDIHATTDVLVGGLTLTRATGTGGNNSADANKVYVDAYITIGPAEETNTVGDPHTFTVNVFQDAGDGLGWVNAPDGTLVTVTLTDSEGSAYAISENTCVPNDDDPPTGGTVDGECSVTFTSPTAGTVTGHASVTLSVGGVSLTRETDGVGLNSEDAIKHFVAGSIAWAKQYAGELQGGATFELCQTHSYILPDGGIDPNPLDPAPPCLTVEDDIGDLGYTGNDEDPLAGKFLVSGLALGRYTVTETVAPGGYELDTTVQTVDLVPGETDADLTGDPFINSRPVLKITGFGYTNAPDGDQPFGITMGTTIFTVNLHNYGTADATLAAGSGLVVSPNASCVGDNTLDLAGETIAAGADSTTYTLTCSYDAPDPAEITATLTTKYATNGQTRDASGSPATITFTVGAED